MKHILTVVILLIILVGGYYLLMHDAEKISRSTNPVTVTPVSHATFALSWAGETLYADPIGGKEVFSDLAAPSLIFVTDVHGDHLNVETLEAVVTEDTTILAPQAVVDMFTEGLLGKTVVLANGETTEQKGFSIEAIPMYNLPDQGVEIRHEKGRGNGYLIERDGTRVYIAGDTADIPEMRMLTDIDIAFIPMNMPYTMDIERAASGVLAFKPAQVYPYHYRGPDGLADVDRFKELVEEGDENIEVILGNWYPAE